MRKMCKILTHIGGGCLLQVLGIFPTTIRRKILRQLYSNPLKDCYLFRDTGVKFLDALMLGARVELFLPKVEIVSALDHANELYIVVAGGFQSTRHARDYVHFQLRFILVALWWAQTLLLLATIISSVESVVC